LSLQDDVIFTSKFAEYKNKSAANANYQPTTILEASKRIL